MSVRKWTKDKYDYETGRYEVVEDYGITVEFEEYGDGGSYEWSMVAVLSKVVDGKVKWAAYTDSGCSCNSAYDMSPKYYNLEWTSDFERVQKEITSFIRQQSFFTAAQVAELNVKLRQWKRDNT